MNAILTKFASCTVLVLLSACSTIDVNENYDPDYDFSKLQTFDWVSATNKKYELILKQVRKELKKQLAAKGFVHNFASADFLIAVHGGTEEKVSVRSTNYGYGYGGWYNGGGVDVYQYKEGTLVLDFIDKKSKQLIYRSESVTEISRNSSAEDRFEKIKKVVAVAIKGFPPGLKKK